MALNMLSIDEIGLSNRSTNALHRVGIHSVGELMQQTEESIRLIRNMGEKSIKETISKIREYNLIEEVGSNIDYNKEMKSPEDFEIWVSEQGGIEYVRKYFNNLKIDALELLSARAYNLLRINGYIYLNQVLFLDEAGIMQIPRMDQACAREIAVLCANYLNENKNKIIEEYNSTLELLFSKKKVSLFDRLYMPEYQDDIKNYVRANDKRINRMGIGKRALNCLQKQRFEMLSDIICLSRSDLMAIPAMGAGSADEILSKIIEYLEINEKRIDMYCAGDEDALFSDELLGEIILDQYQELGFGGLSLDELAERLKFPESVNRERLKKIMGSLLAKGELEYVDYRCYRIYERFEDYIDKCDIIEERSKEIIHKRLEGNTLESIGIQYQLTRERVNQLIKRDVQIIRDDHATKRGKDFFDEDYYRYFYETYSFEKNDAIEWLGMTNSTLIYLNTIGAKKGKKDLETALEDKKLDVGLRLKVKSFLNRNKLFVDGIWIEKRRADLENFVVRKYCGRDVNIDDFSCIYNNFLEENGIDYDESLYSTHSTIRTRENALRGSRFVLWKMKGIFRYYDIDGRDFSELLDTLNIEAYENIEFSTVKFIEEYPELMEKYDIHDQYELHNLLRKIVPEGSYHDFHCEKMPTIRFGTFDRNGAIRDILIEYAPIEATALYQIIHERYGYDIAVIQGTYMQDFRAYYNDGVYRIEQKVMNLEIQNEFKESLIENFYYIDEIKKIYHKLFPEADIDEVNSYNLKMMGFSVLQNYIYQNYSSLDALFEDMLTQNEIMDISPLRRRFAYVQAFGIKLMDLKQELRIVEFEPNQIISFSKLENAGITREMICDFCDDVHDFAEEGTYFSIQSIRRNGFNSTLFDLGFSDWFYSNLLITDDRFTYGKMFGTIVLFKGKEAITVKSFLVSRIKEHGSIDTYDLMDELVQLYGCAISERSETVYRTSGTEIIYDKTLDRLYANDDLFNRELDESEGI